MEVATQPHVPRSDLAVPEDITTIGKLTFHLTEGRFLRILQSLASFLLLGSPRPQYILAWASLERGISRMPLPMSFHFPTLLEVSYSCRAKKKKRRDPCPKDGVSQ